MDEMDKFIYFHLSMGNLSECDATLETNVGDIIFSRKTICILSAISLLYSSVGFLYHVIFNFFFFRLLICLQFYLPLNFPGSGQKPKTKIFFSIKGYIPKRKL